MNGPETMPHDFEAEEWATGSVLLGSNETAARVLEIASPRDFYRDKNRFVMEAVQRLLGANEPVNPMTVAEALRKDGRIDAVGGMAYLSFLLENTPTSAHAEDYARAVRKHSRQRDIIDASEAIRSMASDGGEPDDVVSEGLERLLAIREERGTGPRLYGDLALDYYDEFCRWVDSGFQPQGVLTGFRNLDRVLNGLRPGNLIIVAGRPSMGKTQLLLQMSRNCARNGNPPLFFSLEMSHRELIHRLVFAEARVSEQEVRGRGDPFGEAERLKDIYRELMELDMWIDDSPSVKTTEAQRRMVSLMAREDVDVMFFDHVSLAGDVLRNENEVQRLGAITKGLKAISRICNVPVVVASQLSREVSKSRSDHRPWLEDLRSSGELEQNADVVLGLYRPEYYFPAKDKDGNTKPWVNFLEIEVLKQRQGKANPRGHFSTGLYYDASTGYMADWSGEFPEVDAE